nr:10844_t:CDS:2 [Entrophospora candida]
MDAEKSINLLNELINRSDLDAGVAKSSNGLLETLKIIQNCTSCKKDDIKENDCFYEFINEILVELEKEKEEQKKNYIIRRLDHELIRIDDVLNGKVLCEDCKEEKIEKLANKLFNMSNELINRRDLTVSITESSNRLIETLKMIQNCTSCKKDNIKEGGYFDVFYRSINEIGNYLIILEKGNHLIIHQLSDKLIEIYDILNENVLCKGCKGEKIEKLTNKLFSSLNKLINRSNLDAGVTNLSDGLLETLNIIQGCTICKKDDIKEDYCFYEFNKLINEIGNYLVELEKGNHLIIHQLSDKLIKIDDILNGNVLCEGCKGEKIEKLTNKLFSLLNRLINRSDLDAGVTNLSDGLLETLNTIQSCTSCKKDNIKEKNCFYKFNKSINEIGNYLATLEKGNHLIINQLDDELIEIDDILNENVLCKGCKGEKIEKLTNKLFSSLNKLINRSDLDAGVTNLSDGLIETLKMIQYCGTCKRDNIKKDYRFYEFNKSINEIENYLVALEKGSHDLNARVTELFETLKIIKNCTSCKKEKENHLIINQLDDALIKIDDVLNGKTLKIMQSCISCKKNSIKEKYFYEFHKSINEIENYLVELEKGNHLIINQLDEELIEMDDVLNVYILCKGCQQEKMEKLTNKLFNSLNELINRNVLNARVTELLETLKIIESCTSCKKDDIEEKHFGKFYRSINEIENYLVALEKEKREQKENDTIIFWLDDALIKIYHVLNGYILCKGCKGGKIEKLTNKLFNSLNKLINRSDLNARVTKSSNELLETLQMIGNCISCKKDNIKENCFCEFNKSINETENYLVELEKEKEEQKKNCTSCKTNMKEVKYFDEFYISINKIENYLVELEKEKEEQKKNDIIFWLDDALIKIDDVLNGKVLCEGCKGEKLTNKLFNSLNELINRSDLMVSITESSNRLIETLKIMQNCTSCKKDNIKENYFDKFHKSINKIDNYLAALEKGNHSIIHQLDDELIEIDDVLNGYILCKVNKSSNELLETLKIIENCISCKKYYIKEVKHFDVFYRSINEIENYLVELEKEKEEQGKRYIINRLDDKLIYIDDVLKPEKKKIIELAESKRQEIIKSEKYLIDEKKHKNHPGSFYTSRALGKSIEQDDISINNLSVLLKLNI